MRIDYHTGVCFLFSLLMASGCSNEAQTRSVRVTGVVLAERKPLSGAVITFEPMEQTPGPKASTLIMNGRYQIDLAAGLQPGTHRVRISMLPPEINKRLDEAIGSQAASHKKPPVIATKYDSDSALTAKLSADQENQCDFSVEFRH